MPKTSKLSMKFILTSAFIGTWIIAASFSDSAVKRNAPQMHVSAVEEYTHAIAVSSSEFSQLTGNYSNSNPGKTHGGCIGKAELQELINSMPTGSSSVKIRFCTDPSSSQTSLIFVGDKQWWEGASKIMYRRNGGSADAFCPTNCNDGNSVTNVSKSMTGADYTALTAAYATANTGKTLGGQIDKSALQALINSLPGNATALYFRFCTDANYNKTSVIFVGGNVNQTGGEKLMLRNGKSALAYCPENCN